MDNHPMEAKLEGHLLCLSISWERQGDCLWPDMEYGGT